MPSDLSCHGQQATSGRVTVGGGAMGAMSQRRGSVTWPCRGTRREVGWTGPALWSSNLRASARMSLHVSFAKEKPRACIRRTKLHFWDGMQHASLMPHTEAKGTGLPSYHRNFVTNSGGISWGRPSTVVVSGGISIRGWRQ